MLRFRCSGDVPKRDAASLPPGTGQTSPNPGIATYGLPRPTSQTTSSKPRNRYIRPPRPPPRPTSQTSSKPRNRYIRPPRPTSQTSPDLLPNPLHKTSSKPRNRYIRSGRVRVTSAHASAERCSGFPGCYFSKPPETQICTARLFGNRNSQGNESHQRSFSTVCS